MKRILITISIVLLVLQLQAQSDATYSQYMFNGLAINPAYAGSQQSMSMTLLTRFQAVGVNGEPNTQTFAAHNSINDQKIGLGLLLMNDKIGVTSQTGGYVSYAYKIKIDDATLSLGLQAGGTMVKANYSELLIDDISDPMFSENLKEFKPNFGTGIYYHSKDFYLGISMPQMLDAGTKKIHQLKPFIVSSGVIFRLSPTLLLKPNLLMRVVDKRLVEFNLNANLLIHEILWLGMSYRPSSSLNAILEVQLTDQLRFGYAYEIGINQYRKANSGSHELMLNYQLIFNKKGVIYPRYF